jgi:dihydrofolate reductase
MIAAMTRNGVIGQENQMPWHLPADFAWFKHCTLGKPVVMGRKTFESIGKPLPGRRNIVMTRSNLDMDGVEIVNSLEQAFVLVRDVEEVMIIGGGSIYQACLPFASKLYLTFIQADIDGDTRFPELDGSWQESYRETYFSDERNRYDMVFKILERKRIPLAWDC